MYQTIRKCRCKMDYIEKYSDYLGDGKHSPVYNKATYKQNNIYYYKIEDSIYFVGEKEKLRSIAKYGDSLEAFNKNEFELYFDKIE